MTSDLVRKRRRPPRIGTRLRELREGRFITQEELAAAVDIRVGNISRWERNQTGPYFRHLRTLAEYFDVPPASLVESDNDDEPLAA